MTTTELVPIEEVPIQAPITLFGTDDPTAVVDRATVVAKALKDVLEDRHLVKRISTREFVLLEGWTLLGSMLGVFAEVEWSRPLEDGWEARAVVRTMSGAVVGASEAMCTRKERLWSTRDDYAIRSMAQTRAMAKALRMPLGFIVQLAGYDPTPADEMPDESPREQAVQETRQRITLGELRDRVLQLAQDKDLPLDVLDKLVQRDYEKPFAAMSVDELVNLGTFLKSGGYDLPTEPAADEREGQVGLAIPATTPPAGLLDEILNVTGGELVDEQPDARSSGVPAAGESGPLPAADGRTRDAREAASKAAARAEAARQAKASA